jgi:hypothetical protein
LLPRVARGFYQVQGNPDLSTWLERGAFGPAELIAAKIREWFDIENKVPALKRIILMIASLDPLGQLERFHHEVMPLLQGLGARDRKSEVSHQGSE